MDKKDVSNLLKNIKNDKERIEKSINAILHMYKLKLNDISITKKKLSPSEIFISSLEECNLKDAKSIMAQKYQKILPAPITILQYKKKNVLFMGSNRAIIFVLKDKMPDCIIVKIPNTIKEPIIISEAKQTLKEVIEKQL